MFGIDHLSGRRFGQYQLRTLLGVGGMGAVYRAWQAALEREVAVKVLSTALTSEPGALERFTREAKTSAALEHAHIVPVYDYGTQNDVSYVVMRLLPGGSLADRLAQREERGLLLPSLADALRLLEQIGGALDYAHSRGVVHRDLKPSNVMFDGRGSAFLVDFGIAKLIGSSTGLTASGTVMGTPSYMSPEQWMTQPITPAADQYALGVMLYAVLNGGAPPFESTTPYGLMHKHLYEMPAPLSEARSDVPAAVDGVLAQALDKKPEDRFPTVLEFVEAFERAVSGARGTLTGLFTFPVQMRRTGAVVDDGPTVTPPEAQESAPAAPGAPETPIVPAPPAARAAPEVPSAVEAPPAHAAPTRPAAPPAETLPPAPAAPDETPPTPVMEPRPAPVSTPAAAPAAAPEPPLEPQRRAPLMPQPSIPAPKLPTPASGQSVPVPPAESAPYVSARRRTLAASRWAGVALVMLVTAAAFLAFNLPRGGNAPADGAVTWRVGDDAVALYSDAVNDPAAQVGTVSDTTLRVVGRSSDGAFLLVLYEGKTLWVLRPDDSALTGGIDSLRVIVPQLPTPVPPFATLRVGAAGAALYDAPYNSDPVQAVNSVPPDTRVSVYGRVGDSSWLLVDYGGARLWLAYSEWLGGLEGELDSVPLVDPFAPVYVVTSAAAPLRAAPSSAPGDIADRAPQDSRLTIFGRTPDEAYLFVAYGNAAYWVYNNSISGFVDGDLSAVTVIDLTPRAYFVVTGASLPLRSTLSTRDDAIIAYATLGSRLELAARTEDNFWLLVWYEGGTYWVYNNGVLGSVDGDPGAVNAVNPDSAVTFVATTDVPLRWQPSSAQSVVVTNAPTGSALLVGGRTPDYGWLQVVFEDNSYWLPNDGSAGYVDGDLNAVSVQTPGFYTYYVVSGDAVPLRGFLNPGDATIIGYAGNGNVLELAARSENNLWLLVWYEGGTYWVYNNGILGYVDGDPGAVYAVDFTYPVTFVTTADALLRVLPAPAVDAVASAPPDTGLRVTARTPDYGWLQVAFGGSVYWLPNDGSFGYLDGDLNALPIIPSPRAYFVMNGTSLPLRNTLSTRDDAIVRRAEGVGTRLELAARTEDNFWLLVWYEGGTYWVYNNGVLGSVDGDPGVVNAVNPDSAVTFVATTDVPLRWEFSTAAGVVARAPRDSVLTIAARTPDYGWVQVIYNDQYYWLPNDGSAGYTDGDLNAVYIAAP